MHNYTQEFLLLYFSGINRTFIGKSLQPYVFKVLHVSVFTAIKKRNDRSLQEHNIITW